MPGFPPVVRFSFLFLFFQKSEGKTNFKNIVWIDIFNCKHPIDFEMDTTQDQSAKLQCITGAGVIANVFYN